MLGNDWVNEALQRAIDCLQISDVFIRDASASLAEHVDPKYYGSFDTLETQFIHIVAKSEVLELSENEESRSLFRVHIALGVRWVERSEDEQTNDSDAVIELARIRAVMVAEYEMKDNPGEEALTAFALKNASYHVWPYWREYLSSQCMRMNLPKLMLPAVQLADNR